MDVLLSIGAILGAVILLMWIVEYVADLLRFKG